MGDYLLVLARNPCDILKYVPGRDKYKPFPEAETATATQDRNRR
jgi:hypothetical protein